MLAAAGLLCCSVITSIVNVQGANLDNNNFLLLHPWYSGSHVLTLHALTERLVARGHNVTTVR